MKKNDTKGMGIQIPKRVRIAGTTFYVRDGQVVGRPAIQHEKRSNTFPQFVQRQKMRHAIALWKMLKLCDVMFTERKNACLNFKSLAMHLLVAYVPDGFMNQSSFLMPDIPVSDGTLPTVKQKLGEVNGTPALLTNLKAEERSEHVKLRLYTAVQTIESGALPRVRFSMREVSWWDMTVVDGHLALVGEEFADEMKGWALVKVIGDRCSSQGIVTRCTVYEQYTTEEALERAANSYGGLTDTPYMSPY